MEHGDVSSTNADWMSQLPEELWGTPLWDLAIPGSHDSMSYCLDTHSPVLGSESFMLQFLDRLAPCIMWCIPDQLDAGIRFFDLRIAHKNIKNTHNTQDLLKTHNTDDTLYFAHAIYTLQTVKEALSTMAVWLKQHQKEVVILSCSHFYLLTDSEHQALVCYITQLFKDKLCPPQVQDRQDPTTACLSQGWGQFSFQKVVSFGVSSCFQEVVLVGVSSCFQEVVPVGVSSCFQEVVPVGVSLCFQEVVPVGVSLCFQEVVPVGVSLCFQEVVPVGVSLCFQEVVPVGVSLCFQEVVPVGVSLCFQEVVPVGVSSRFQEVVPVGETPYLSQCWDLGQQVIVSYDDETILHQHKELWPKIPYWYADSADPKEVISYLEEQQKAQGRAAHFFTSGLNLTEDTAVVVCNPCLTMRKLTMKSFSLLLDWVEKQTPGPDQTAVNIICGDFVGLNHFASVVIGLNKKLLKTESHR
ncbi:PI-PLC X domain-containing protein 1-like isoform X2 [Salvelinus fontinalis]|uniref:PI-PLC X domain-containing protein 1-like isoform X2 n=1 Tax=Salvelinus fontinalis TaxID=8038 RepID=UPI002484EEDC|nr:PI-PLC X domain-containing protein 1-like isoform X2 [Salvelinus fontinalis]